MCVRGCVLLFLCTGRLAASGQTEVSRYVCVRVCVCVCVLFPCTDRFAASGQTEVSRYVCVRVRVCVCVCVCVVFCTDRLAASG